MRTFDCHLTWQNLTNYNFAQFSQYQNGKRPSWLHTGETVLDCLRVCPRTWLHTLWISSMHCFFTNKDAFHAWHYSPSFHFLFVLNSFWKYYIGFIILGIMACANLMLILSSGFYFLFSPVLCLVLVVI